MVWYPAGGPGTESSDHPARGGKTAVLIGSPAIARCASSGTRVPARSAAGGGAAARRGVKGEKPKACGEKKTRERREISTRRLRVAASDRYVEGTERGGGGSATRLFCFLRGFMSK
jgi:hypothetical protein